MRTGSGRFFLLAKKRVTGKGFDIKDSKYSANILQCSWFGSKPHRRKISLKDMFFVCLKCIYVYIFFILCLCVSFCFFFVCFCVSLFLCLFSVHVFVYNYFPRKEGCLSMNMFLYNRYNIYIYILIYIYIPADIHTSTYMDLLTHADCISMSYQNISGAPR